MVSQSTVSEADLMTFLLANLEPEDESNCEVVYPALYSLEGGTYQPYEPTADDIRAGLRFTTSGELRADLSRGMRQDENGYDLTTSGKVLYLSGGVRGSLNDLPSGSEAFRITFCYARNQDYLLVNPDADADLRYDEETEKYTLLVDQANLLKNDLEAKLETADSECGVTFIDLYILDEVEGTYVPFPKQYSHILKLTSAGDLDVDLASAGLTTDDGRRLIIYFSGGHRARWEQDDSADPAAIAEAEQAAIDAALAKTEAVAELARI